jgi:tight adherence protein B
VIAVGALGLVVVGSVSAACYVLLVADDGAPRRVFLAYAARLEVHASFLRMKRSGGYIARMQCSALIALALLGAASWSLVVAAAMGVVAIGPLLLLRRRHARRVLELERQLDIWLLMLANALRSTPSVGEAVVSTAALVPAPFREEVDLVIKEVRLGAPLDRALSSFAARVNSIVLSGALMMIVVARQTGGDLASTLERAASALRESARLEGVLRSKTAEGRGQVVVLALVPFVLCVVIAALDASWFQPMLASSLGQTVLGGCALAWGVAALWAYRIAGTEL